MPGRCPPRILCDIGRALRVLAEMLERGCELGGRGLLGIDTQRRLGHDALEVLEIGVVPQCFKHPRGAAVGDVGSGGEDSAQQVGAGLVQDRKPLRVRGPSGRAG